MPRHNPVTDLLCELLIIATLVPSKRVTRAESAARDGQTERAKGREEYDGPQAPVGFVDFLFQPRPMRYGASVRISA
jgi:hypothetical protein